jgi:hypothetical protein
MKKTESNIWITIILTLGFIISTIIICSFLYYNERNNEINGYGMIKNNYKTIAVTGKAERVFIANVMIIEVTFTDNKKRNAYKEFIIEEDISKDQIVTYDKKLYIETDLVIKMEGIYFDKEANIKYQPKYTRPKYVVGNTEDLKFSLLELGTRNARNKASIIADHANSVLGKLLKSDSGVVKFQNIGAKELYNNPDELNPFTKRKKALISIKQTYKIN